MTKKVEEVMNSKTSARSSRQKRTRQRVIHTTSSSESDESEPDGGARAPRQMPNFVNLDSDDEYAEAPISINRNLVSDSAALQASENEEMKVAVKFGLTVEDYMLRPVCDTFHRHLLLNIDFQLKFNFPIYLAVPKIVGADHKSCSTQIGHGRKNFSHVQPENYIAVKHTALH